MFAKWCKFISLEMLAHCLHKRVCKLVDDSCLIFSICFNQGYLSIFIFALAYHTAAVLLLDTMNPVLRRSYTIVRYVLNTSLF